MINNLHKAWWRGRKVAESGHQLSWYKDSLSKYLATEHAAFMEGFTSAAGGRCPYPA
jgi:hypothetical protein